MKRNIYVGLYTHVKWISVLLDCTYHFLSLITIILSRVGGGTCDENNGF
jgi:hypothetical protein